MGVVISLLAAIFNIIKRMYIRSATIIAGCIGSAGNGATNSKSKLFPFLLIDAYHID